MEFSQPSDSSGASPEAPAATPAAAAPSTSAPEAFSGEQASPIAENVAESQSAETVGAPSVDELPDDDAFGQLPGAERATNWQKARTRIAELNSRVEQLAALEAQKPIFEKIEEFGGFDQLQAGAELARNLFVPLTDEQGQEVRDEQGLPQYTARPFVDQLHQESPSTLWEIALSAMDLPVDQSQTTLRDWMIREHLGLDPALLDTYRQIRTPQDAAQFTQAATTADPEALAQIPEDYHAAFKSCSPNQQNELLLMADDARDAFLMERAELLESRAFRDQQKAAEAQRAQEREQAWKQQLHEAGEKRIQDVQSRIVNAQRERLKAEVPFFGPEATADNERIWGEIINTSMMNVMQNPSLTADITRIDSLYRLAAQFEMQGDQFKARQASVEADRLTVKVDHAFKNAVTKHSGWWSQKLGFARNAQTSAIQNAQPRVEIASGNAPASRNNAPSPPQGGGFGFAGDRIKQWAAQLEQASLR